MQQLAVSAFTAASSIERSTSPLAMNYSLAFANSSPLFIVPKTMRPWSSVTRSRRTKGFAMNLPSTFKAGAEYAD